VFIISLIISLCIFIIFEISLNQIYKLYSHIKTEIETIPEEINEINKEENIEIMKESNSKEKESENTNENIWQVEIPIINLIAPIEQGTSQEVMLEFVGHFENTSTWNGNIGLAAHNRGYPINYFSRLKELKIGDEIIYRTEAGTKTYYTEIIKIIEDTDWSYLQSTEDSRITLITCVENEPSKRLCIQGIEI